jgi:ELWxxDGT repeat protein
MFGVLLALLLHQTPAEVRALPIGGGRTSELQLVAADARSVWFRARTSQDFAGGGPGLFRLDRIDGGIRSIASAREALSTFRNESLVRPVPWGDETLLTEVAVLRPGLGSQARLGRLVAGTPNSALMQAIGSTQLQLWRLGQPPRSLDFDVRGQAVALPDGRLAVDVTPSGQASSSAVLIVAADGGQTVLPDHQLGGRLGSTLVLRRSGGAFLETGERLGDLTVFQGRDLGQPRILVGLRDGGLFVSDGRPDSGQMLRTGQRGIRLPTAVVGERLVTFRLEDGGVLVERLGDGARFENPLIDGVLVFDRGRVRLLGTDLEVLEDGGLGPIPESPPCAWRRFGDQSPEELCLARGTLLRRASQDASVEVLAERLSAPEVSPSWLVDSSRDRLGLFLSEGQREHWTDGIESFTLGTGERLVGRVGDGFLVATDGLTLIDRRTGARTAFGLPLAARPLPSTTELLVELPSCRVLRRTTGIDFEEFWSGTCVDDVVEGAGSMLLVTKDRHAWWKSGLERPVPIAMATIGSPWSDSRQSELARFGDVSWVTTAYRSSVAVDLRTGQTVGSLPLEMLRLNRLGAIGTTSTGTRSWVRFDGGAFPFEDDFGSRGVLFSFVGEDAAWLVGSLVQATTGERPSVLPGVDGGDWWRAAAVKGVLLRATEDFLEVLSPDGGLRRIVVDVADPTELKTHQGRVWFSARDDLHGVEPWVFDGHDAQLIADLVPGPGSSFPQFLGPVPRGVLLQAGRADGTIGAVAVLTEPEPSPETRAFTGGGCSTAAGLPLVALLALLTRRWR